MYGESPANIKPFIRERPKFQRKANAIESATTVILLLAIMVRQELAHLIR